MLLTHGEGKTIICVTGMHRSGTSLVMHLLSICGVHLGSKDDLMSPTEDNLDGYWENWRFVKVNHGIIAKLGGSWDNPPASLEDLATTKRLKTLRAEAGKLLREFDGCSLWGWKDPRTSLSLSFWKNLIPSLKVVVCLRNPWEVGLSLRRRRHTPSPLGLTLWRSYNQKILDTTTPTERIITHYDAYFTRPEAELRRVLNYLDIEPDIYMIEQCRAIISERLRHYRHSPLDTEEEAAASVLINSEMYERLSSEAEYSGRPS